MTKQLRDAAALIKTRGFPTERMVQVSVLASTTMFFIEFSTEEAAATFGATKLSDGTPTQRIETSTSVAFSTEVTFRGRLYSIYLSVPKNVEQPALAQS